MICLTWIIAYSCNSKVIFFLLYYEGVMAIYLIVHTLQSKNHGDHHKIRDSTHSEKITILLKNVIQWMYYCDMIRYYSLM